MILDEPTTALDVIVQAQIINLLKKLKKTFDLSFIFITHDLALEAEVSDRICVMYAGKIAELGTNQQIYGPQGPAAPYTKRLLAATPAPAQQGREPVLHPGHAARPHRPAGRLPVPSSLSTRSMIAAASRNLPAGR